MQDDTSSKLLDPLIALERLLHQPAVRADAAAVERLLHPQFREFGRSGRSYSRAAMLELLAAEDPADTSIEVVSQDFALQMLGDNAALLTYRSAHRSPDGHLSRPSWRSSIWRLEALGWQMIFHQGTATAAF
ncbi:nuclear transport factor 2 family protein [Paucibacter sp. Y2R2-4]|uniref:nuclear transport factor 2 family protein n=1 Tax=Paucibacter sp. Y2R2-4 TaxID=2893553 RepID=UPI0021E3593E|nr:nuclear transport factor 2 family protein [Paucibacter sp. Y2R2-4]MCV2350459.1 nuclear transport factor 2 family protein [Paucibacter sp. Y2R2-4]